MGRLYVASVLMSISRKQPAPVEEAELAPMTPGAWAAWAEDWKAERAALAAASEPQTEPQAVPAVADLQPVVSEI